MSIYLGTSGGIKLQRLATTAFTTTVNTDSVNVGQKRLSVDFPATGLLTGDRVFIERVTAGNLDFISGYVSNSGTFYLNVDIIGGIKIFNTWADSLNGSVSKALALAIPGTQYNITIESLGDGPRDLGQITSYEINTTRATANTTSLGDQFAKSIATLISGSGTISCFWDFAEVKNGEEASQLFHQLVLRQQLGSNFRAALIIKRTNEQSAHETGEEDSEGLFYLVNAIVTEVALAFEPSEPLRSEIQFVTTGQIALRYGSPLGDLLLQEDSDEIQLEQSSGSLLLDDL